MPSPDHVRRTADELGIQVALHEDLGPTPTVADAAEALGVGVGDIGKSIVMMVADRPVVIMAPGDAHIDPARVADALGAGADQVRMATPDEVERHTGFAVGAVAPVGLPDDLVKLVDEGLIGKERLVMGGGSRDVLVELGGPGLGTLPNARVGSYCK